MEKSMMLISLPLEEFTDLLDHHIRDALRELQSLEPTPRPKEEPLLTIDQAAAYFGKSRQTIHSWKKKGIIPFHRISGRIYFKRSELARSLKKIDLSS